MINALTPSLSSIVGVQLLPQKFSCQCIFPKASESKELSWGSRHVVVPLVFHDELTLLGAKVFDKVSSSTSSVLFILFRISSCSFDNNHKTITFHFLFVLDEKVVVKSAFLMWSWKKVFMRFQKQSFWLRENCGNTHISSHCGQKFLKKYLLLNFNKLQSRIWIRYLGWWWPQ